MAKQFVEIDEETYKELSEAAGQLGMDVSEYLHMVAKKFAEGVVTPPDFLAKDAGD